MRTWFKLSELDHENIIKLEGFLLNDLNPPSATIITRWADGGTLDEFVRNHPKCDFVEIVRTTNVTNRNAC